MPCLTFKAFASFVGGPAERTRANVRFYLGVSTYPARHVPHAPAGSGRSKQACRRAELSGNQRPADRYYGCVTTGKVITGTLHLVQHGHGRGFVAEPP